jgi:ankyrin repeat protein
MRSTGFRPRRNVSLLFAVVCTATLLGVALAVAQTPPSPAEIAGYRGLHAAAAAGDSAEITRLIAAGADPKAQDGNGRTALHVAAFGSHLDAASALVKGGAGPRALDHQRYDIITIAAVKDDVPMLKRAIELGASAREITSPYDGTALIAAAHLGHDGVVRELIRAGAPLDHVNNLGWTALIEAVILGDGGARHTACVRALVEAGANPRLADRAGVTPLEHARRRGYAAMVAILEAAERRP